MNTVADFDGGDSATRRRPAGQKKTPPGAPSAIHITMPERNPGNAARTRGDPQDRIEALLGKLMARLDENDRRYSQALDTLNNGLNRLSRPARASETSTPAGPAAALDRVREQASSLAAQVQDAGTAHRDRKTTSLHGIEQRLETFAGRHEEELAAGEDTRDSENFEDLAKHLDKSLAAHAPGNEFDMLARRMDDLARHFDAALAAKDDSGTLRSIETQLKEISTAFANAQQHYARIEAIEGHVLSLMNWAESANTPGNGGDTPQRLDAMNDALDALAARFELSANGNDGIGNDGIGNGDRDDAANDRPPAGGAPRGGEKFAEVIIDKDPGSEPGYQSAPVFRGGTSETPPDAGHAAARARQQGSVEASFDADSDWVASARRAADAADAQASRPVPSRSRSAPEKPVLSATTAAAPAGSKRSRLLFIAAAVALLLISAAILLVRLQASPDAAAIGTLQNNAPKPPVAAPRTPADAGQRSSLPGADTGNKKQHSGRLLTGPPPAASAPPAAPAPAAKPQSPAPVRKTQFSIPPQQNVTTATLLASLAPKTIPELLAGVEMSITESAAYAPAPRTGAVAPAATPALVPYAAFTPRPNPLPQPKRISVPGSAPASKRPLPMPSRLAAMPPARIGPHSLRMAAARGNPAAQTEIASRFAKGTGVAKNLKMAVKWYGRAAAQSFAPAQYRLAALHERGLGVKKDIALARTWYRRAAELGNIRAMHNLAVLYTRTGAKGPDYKKAKNWFHEAARHGLADSQFNLGILYESGLGATKNAAEAYKWFALAARQGDAEARKRRELVRVKLTARSLSGVENTLKRWIAAKAEPAANKTGQPRGGWRNAKAPDPARKAGAKLIAQAQYLLNKLGYDAGLPDGKLGPKTVAAIRRFESRSGGLKSGRVTPALLHKLEALNS